MVSSAEMLAAFRELSNSKQLDRTELYGLLQDGFMAALAKKYGPTVQAEVDIDDSRGEIRIVLLKTVVESVEDSAREISLEEAKIFDEADTGWGDPQRWNAFHQGQRVIQGLRRVLGRASQSSTLHR